MIFSDIPPYKPSLWLRNGHINSIYSANIRKVAKPNYKRTIIRTVDDDGLFVDTLVKGYRRLAVLCHGLEGSAYSIYMRSVAQKLHDNQWDVMCINFRSCGGVMNKTLRMYHSGETSDLHTVLRYHQSPYDNIALIGFSLGGNVILKYLGEDTSRVHHKVSHAIAVSAPVDLAGSSHAISKKQNFLYQKMFFKSLIPKIEAKAKQFPNDINLEHLTKINTLHDFDEYFTSRLHGFEDANDYYTKSSSLQYLKNINRPTWLITAQDDPFLSEGCYPDHIAESSYYFNMIKTEYGGHVGFAQPGENSWHEDVILKLLEIEPTSN